MVYYPVRPLQLPTFTNIVAIQVEEFPTLQAYRPAEDATTE
jgi:hypothetical protein